MKTASEISQRYVYGKPTVRNTEQQQPRPNDDATADIVNKIFTQLKVAFPAWKNSFPDEQSQQMAKKIWIQALSENGVNTLQQVAHGMRKARASTNPFWPAVGQFIAWCSPSAEELGLPSPQEAYREACSYRSQHTFSHPAVYVATKSVGEWELSRDEGRRMYPIFERAYEIACGRVMRGEDLSGEIPAALPSPEQVPTTREELGRAKAAGREALAELRQTLGMTSKGVEQ